MYTLSQLNRLVAQAINTVMTGTYWVTAELSEARTVRGHLYMELIEKDALSNTPVAKAKAQCWQSAWNIIGPRFRQVTGRPLAAGMKVMLRVRPQFHERYGFSWIVTDIDPTFTLGDMARKRLDIINKLKAEGVLELNKQLPLPLFAQRIAVISTAGAAGYGDFRHQLRHNGYGLYFETTLFEAVMQGEGVETEVIAALDKINSLAGNFDCVVIIRGGGATSDLSGFDTLALAENVANFPLPVITGIGHERDESVLDMVAHTAVKTPTAAAALLIDNLQKVASMLDEAQLTITRVAEKVITDEKTRIERLATAIPSIVALYGERQQNTITVMTTRLHTAVMRIIDNARRRIDIAATVMTPAATRMLADAGHRIDILQQHAEALDPMHILKRGYSITMHNGRTVTDASTLHDGDIITTRMKEGEIISTVKGE